MLFVQTCRKIPKRKKKHIPEVYCGPCQIAFFVKSERKEKPKRYLTIKNPFGIDCVKNNPYFSRLPFL